MIPGCRDTLFSGRAGESGGSRDPFDFDTLPDISIVLPIDGSAVRLAVAQRILRDDELLNVHRSLDDLIGLGVAIITLDWKFRRVAIGAEDLERAVCAKGGCFGSGVFRHGDFQVV